MAFVRRESMALMVEGVRGFFTSGSNGVTSPRMSFRPKTRSEGSKESAFETRIFALLVNAGVSKSDAVLNTLSNSSKVSGLRNEVSWGIRGLMAFRTFSILPIVEKRWNTHKVLVAKKIICLVQNFC